MHGVDVEGKASGIEEELIKILEQAEIPVTMPAGLEVLMIWNVFGKLVMERLILQSEVRWIFLADRFRMML